MSLLAALVLAAPLRVLFLGNSHTQYNDVPALVAGLGRERGNSIVTEVRYGATLYHMHGDTQIRNTVASGRYDVIVLQAQALSTSHKYRYSDAEAIDFAKSGKKAGAKVFLFAEWPRRGVDETAYIEGIYKRIADASGATIIPVGRVWDSVLRQRNLTLWAQDGNHAAPLGSRLAAFAIYRAITQDKAEGNPRLDLDAPVATLFWKSAEVVVK